MKKRILGLLLALAMLLSIIPLTAMPAEAASPTYLDRVNIRVDVPVDGVDLKMKADIWVYSDYIKGYYWDDKIPVTYTPYWYEQGSGTPIQKGTKAILGKTYDLNIRVTPKSGYAFRANLVDYPTTINGTEVTPVTNGDGTWAFHATYTAIPASKEPLRAYYKDLQLSPYEGNPVEMSVEATGGTNIKYQWYILHGAGFDAGALDYGGAIPLMDNYCWEGCQTPNFKVRSSFGNYFDGTFGADHFPFACVVTSDTDSVTLTKLTFSTRERTVVNEATFTDLTIPSYGAIADWTVSSGDSSKYTVTGVQWYGPKIGVKYTTLMSEGDTFVGGTYKCRIYVSVTDAYKFDENTKATIGKNPATITTLPGKDLNPMGPDSYYIEREYSVTQNPSFTVQPVGGTVTPGEKLNVQWETNFTPYRTTILAYDAEEDDTSSGYLINPAGNSMSFSATALDGSYYQIRAYYTDTKYVASDKIYVTNTTDHTVKIAGVTVKDGEFFDDDALTAMKTPSDSSYAYYKDGVLLLAGFQDGFADIVYTIPSLTIIYLGDVQIQSIHQDPSPVIEGIQNDLYVWGSGTLDISGGYEDYSIFVEGNVTFGKGSVTMNDAGVYAFNYTKSVTIKDGGTVYCSCSQGGIFSNGDRQISVQEGSLHIYDAGTWYQSIPNNTVIKKGNVYVGKDFELEKCQAWNGVDKLSNYDSIWIVGTPGSSVTVGGITLYDGDYLSQSGAVSGQILTDHYANYQDGILTLRNFDYSGIGYEYNENLDSYGLIYAKTPLQLMLLGENTLTQKDNVGTCQGIVALQGVTIDGEGALTLNVNGQGILADQGHVSLKKGNLTIKSSGDDGIKTQTGDVVISGGSLSVSTDYIGINAQRDVLVTGGKSTLLAEDAIRAKANFTMDDGSLVIVADWYGVYAGSDITINGGNISAYTQGDALRADYGTATITDGNITLLAGCDGIYAYDDEEKTDILIEGGVIGISAKGYSLDAACSNLCINGGDLILYSGETEYDEDYCALRAYEKILFGENIHAGASTESTGTLGTYDPAKNDTYDYVVISPRGSYTAGINVNCVGKAVTYTVSGNVVTVTNDMPCKVGYLGSDGKYVTLKGTKNSDGSYSFTAPDGVTEVLLGIKGDITGDGKINIIDVSKLYAHVKQASLLSGDILFIADLTGDGRINVIDVSKLYAHVKQAALLTWDT